MHKCLVQAKLQKCISSANRKSQCVAPLSSTLWKKKKDATNVVQLFKIYFVCWVLCTALQSIVLFFYLMQFYFEVSTRADCGFHELKTRVWKMQHFCTQIFSLCRGKLFYLYVMKKDTQRIKQFEQICLTPVRSCVHYETD